MKRDLSISRAWDETKARIAADGRLFVAVALALIVLPQVILGVVVSPATEGPASGGVQLVLLAAILLAFAGQIAVSRLAIAPPTTVAGALVRGMRQLPWFVIAFLIVILVATLVTFVVVFIAVLSGLWAPATPPVPTLGMMAFVTIVMLLIFAKLQLIVPVAAAEDLNPFLLVRRAWTLSKGNYLRLLAFLLLVVVGIVVIFLFSQSIAGILATVLFGEIEAFSIGALVLAILVSLPQAAFSVVAAVMLARIYVQLAGSSDADVSVPSSGT